jgi:tRNA-specific adenosine deaminase 3
MDEEDRSIKRSLAAQDPIVRELVQDDVEHGVLIPLKTTLELRDDYQTGHVLITRTPTKAANPAILYARPSPSQICFPLTLPQSAAQPTTR